MTKGGLVNSLKVMIFRLPRWLLFLSVFLTWQMGWADPDINYVESTREMVSNRVLRLSDRIDSIFGNTTYDDRRNTSTLRVEQTFYSKDGELGLEKPSTALNLYLPNLQGLEKRIKERFFSPGPSGADRQISEDEFNEVNPWSFSQETGVVVTWPLNYYARVRARRDFLTGPIVHSFYEQIGWSKSNEWEEKTSLTSDYALSESLLFRVINDKDWALTNGDLGTTHGPSLIYQLTSRTGISLDLRYQTQLYIEGLDVKRMWAGVTYRGVTSLSWIYWSINPEVVWEREIDFRPLYNVYLKFTFLFGRDETEGI